MATTIGALSVEQFQCPICLDVLSEPVSTPCGHNFCGACIKRNWDACVTCQCPLCKETFFRRPVLRVNTTLRDVAQLVRHQRDSGHDLVPARDGDVPCDVCSGDGNKLRAVKSCLDCGTSFCVLHLEIHQRAPNLQRHTLTEPLQNLEERVCQKHRRPLELFCREDGACVCEFCTEGDHRNHNTVPLEEESKDRKVRHTHTRTPTHTHPNQIPFKYFLNTPCSLLICLLNTHSHVNLSKLASF
ncbi:hypothetical protein ACEWY4_001254 [Coilia grayii]|uniref:Uncharacterized protein n=1 Tax=Coilia grayii TaxID=363190 RepID=A0ABD1KZG6_9TELE